MKRLKAAIAVAAVICIAGPASAGHQFRDIGLFTTYSATPTTVSWSTCGILDGQHGCYGSGSLSPPFENVCAVMEGARTQNGKVVSRQIYVLDKGSTPSGTMVLYVFKRTDRISIGAIDLINVTSAGSILTQLGGGPHAHCQMAADGYVVYVGTDVAPYNAEVAAISKFTGTLTLLPLSSPLVSITAEDRGYVALHSTGGSEVVQEGEVLQTIDGPADMADQHNAWKSK